MPSDKASNTPDTAHDGSAVPATHASSDDPTPVASTEASINASTDQLSAQLYEELRAIARRIRRDDRDEHTLDTTAIVHEAFLRLSARDATPWPSRSYFLGAAARTMRRVLVDYARERGAAKRDGGMRTTLISIAGAEGGDPLDVLAIDDLLDRLAALDERQAQVVELRVFGGFEVDEVAEIIGVSPKTVHRDWRFAKAWLTCRLAETE
ncbi:MAG: ECF-type sigma factor [Gemmatimonadota bacterium]|nr:ECF-type sigma factor [Gemmatimonadota bacterium]